MLEWLRSAVQISDVPDLASAWNDGRNLSALVDYCQPGLIPDHASLDPEQRLGNLKRAMDLAEQHLNIPQLMHPEDLAVDKPDKLSTMTYLSQFCCPNSVGEKALLEFVRKKLPSHNITNFTTDWVDGRVLGALTAAVCSYDPQPNDTNPTDRCQAAMMAAEANLFIRNVLETSDFINPDLDPHLRMAYLVEVHHATQPPLILETHVPDRAGSGQEVVVELEVPQHGRVEALAFGTAKGQTAVTVESIDASHARVKIAVEVRDEYTVRITHNGRVVRGCPFIIALDTYSVPHTDTSMPRKVGDKCSLTFDTSLIDGRPIEAKVSGKTAGTIVHTMEKSSDHSILSFSPSCLDTYTVTICVEGKPVKESPFVVPLSELVEPQKVVCGELVSSGVNSAVSMAIDCKKAGNGVLTASCRGQSSGDVPVRIITTDDLPSAITFTPNSEDLYLLQVLYEGGEIPGSPWCSDFRNLPPQPDKVRVVNSPTGSLEVGKLLNVVFDTNDAGSGQLTASCTGSTCGDIPVSITTVGLGEYQIGFVPMVPDNYFVTVSWAGVPIPGTPFQISFGCKPVNASKCKLVGLTGNPTLVKVKRIYQGLVGREIALQVKTAEAGKGTLDVKVQTPSGEIVITPQPSSDDPDTLRVCYTPPSVGHYCMHLMWGKNTIPLSPINFEVVSPLTFPLGGPVTVELELDGKKKDLNGEALLQREGLPKKISATVDKSNNKRVVLSLEPSKMEPGTYLLSVFSKYRELPNSPVLLVYAQEAANAKESETEIVTIGAEGSEVNIPKTLPPSPESAMESASPVSDLDSRARDSTDGPLQVTEASSKPENGSHSLPEPAVESITEINVRTTTCSLVGVSSCEAIQRTGPTGRLLALIGRDVEFKVRTGEVEGRLTGYVEGPGHDPQLILHPSTEDPSLWQVKLSPLQPGPHRVHLLWNDSPIPGTPLELEAVSPHVFPLHSPVKLQVASDAKKKELKVHAILKQDESRHNVKIEKVDGRSITLLLQPVKPGTYMVCLSRGEQELDVSPVVVEYGLSRPEELVPVVSERVAEEVVAVDTVLLESKPPTVEVGKTPEDTVTGTLTVLETLSPSGSGLSPSKMPRDSSHSSDLTRDGSHTPDMPPISHSDENRREMSPSISSHGQDKRVSPLQGATPSPLGSAGKAAPTSPDLHPPPSQTTPSHDTSPLPTTPALHGSSRLEETVEESRSTLADSSANGAVQQQLSDAALESSKGKEEETAKGKKGKKKLKDKEEQKAKSKKEKEKEKAEKAEKTKKEKDEKKKKKERKKAGGLNLEDQEFRVGIKMKYKLHCEDLGSKAPEIACKPPEAAKHVIIPAPQYGRNSYWCEITPTRVGEMEVSIVYEDFHILGSPFSVNIDPCGDASQCTMVDPSPTCTKQTKDNLLFCIEVPESAGKGDLTASARNAETKKRLHNILMTEVSKQHRHIEFNPSDGLEYTLSVRYDEHHIKGSPFSISLGDPSKCKVHGEGIKQAQVEDENTFVVDGTDAGPGELRVKITGEGKTIEPKITVTGEKEYRVSYATQKPGQYRLSVQWGDGHVPNSPFTVPCIGSSQFSIVDIVRQAYVGGVMNTQVVTTAKQIRHKQLSVFAHPKTDISKMFSGQIAETREGIFTCSLHPTQAHVGLCKVHICWNGKEIQGSPYSLNIADTPSPDDFTLEAVETASGDIAVHVHGPTDVFATEEVVATVDNLFKGEQVPATVTKLTNEKCSIQMLPTVGGEYQLSILYAGTHVANSPLVLTQADPSQCLVSGEGVRVSKVDELSKFTVDHSNAGMGHLRIDIEGEGGNTIEPFIASGETLSEVTYISKYVGVYRIAAHWGEHELPGSPFTMYTVDPSKFSLTEKVAKRFPVGQTMSFSIQARGHVNDWERLSVTAKLIHKQKVYRGTVEMDESHDGRKYQCALDIPETGHYAVYVQCRGMDIPGSPFTIRMMSAPMLDKVRVSGTGLKSGTVGQRQEFTMDTREAGFGHIGLKVDGPGGGLSIKMHNHDTLARVIVAEYTPVYSGKYTIHLMWAGLVVPGGPYSVIVHDRERGEMEDYSNRERVRGEGGDE